jgi:hypothetical protein
VLGQILIYFCVLCGFVISCITDRRRWTAWGKVLGLNRREITRGVREVLIEGRHDTYSSLNIIWEIREEYVGGIRSITKFEKFIKTMVTTRYLRHIGMDGR